MPPEPKTSLLRGLAARALPALRPRARCSATARAARTCERCGLSYALRRHRRRAGRVRASSSWAFSSSALRCSSSSSSARRRGCTSCCGALLTPLLALVLLRVLKADADRAAVQAQGRGRPPRPRLMRAMPRQADAERLRARGLLWPAVFAAHRPRRSSSRSATGRCGGKRGRRGCIAAIAARAHAAPICARRGARSAARRRRIPARQGARARFLQRPRAAPLRLRRAGRRSAGTSTRRCELADGSSCSSTAASCRTS